MSREKKVIWIVNEYNPPVSKRTRQIVLSQYLEEAGYSVYLIAGSKVHGKDDNLINTANGNYLKLLDTFISDSSNFNEELCICSIKQLYNKVEIPELGLLSGGTVLRSLIKDKRTSMNLIGKLRELSSKMTTNG